MKLLPTISIIASLALAPVVSSAQGFTGLISINRTVNSPELKSPTDPVSHTFVASVGNGVVMASASWGDNSILLGAWGRNTLIETMPAYVNSSTAIAQSAFDLGLYNVIYTGGTFDNFNSTYADTSTGFAHPNLGFVFSCKWAAWAFGNNFYYAATGTPRPTVYDVPDPAYTNTEQWMEAHLHPAYWMALQRSATDPMALQNYNNAITLQTQLKDKLM